MNRPTWDKLAGADLDAIFTVPTTATGPDFGDRYEVMEKLGSGGQGEVWKARDRTLGRLVAVKRLKPNAPPGHVALLRAEADLLMRLHHPAIPQVHDQGMGADGAWYVVMHLVEGERLDRWLARAMPTLEERLRVLTEVADAVAHAHSRNLWHRDLKPQNVIVDVQGRPFLVDWGLAAQGMDRAVCGSPYFASPEQLQGQVADKRADVYALGVLLYWITSGELPYARRVSDFKEFQAHRAGLQRVPLEDRLGRGAVIRRLDQVIARAMAPQAAARHASVAAFLADLPRTVAAEAAAAVRDGRPTAARPALLFTAGAGAGAAVMALVVFLAGGFHAAADTPPPTTPITAHWPIGAGRTTPAPTAPAEPDPTQGGSWWTPEVPPPIAPPAIDPAVVPPVADPIWPEFGLPRPAVPAPQDPGHPIHPTHEGWPTARDPAATVPAAVQPPTTTPAAPATAHADPGSTPVALPVAEPAPPLPAKPIRRDSDFPDESTRPVPVPVPVPIGDLPTP